MASAKSRHRLLRILRVTEELGLAEKKIFTVGELEAIAREAECEMIEVMRVLRNR